MRRAVLLARRPWAQRCGGLGWLRAALRASGPSPYPLPAFIFAVWLARARAATPTGPRPLLVNLRMTTPPSRYETPSGNDGSGVWKSAYFAIRGSGDLKDIFAPAPIRAASRATSGSQTGASPFAAISSSRACQGAANGRSLCRMSLSCERTRASTTTSSGWQDARSSRRSASRSWVRGR